MIRFTAVTALTLSLVTLCNAQSDLGQVKGLSCPKAGYMIPDKENLCFVWFCESAGANPVKRACPKGVRVPSWWDGGELNMCFVTNIEKHYGEPTCLRCAANDIPPDTDGCSSNPCPEECTCKNTEYTYRCDCPYSGIVTDAEYVPPPKDHCQPNLCENGATCQNQWDGYFCFCPPGWTGHRCEVNVCDWHPCLNGATCIVDDIGYHCECTACWTGSCCNVTVPRCLLADAKACATCKTGANCESHINDTCDCIPPSDNPCAAGTECVDGNNGPECQACDEPECFLEGCKIRKDTCACTKQKCPANSRCEDLPDVNSHECICDECWEGPSCNIKKSTCACNNPCPETSTCKDTPEGPMCECKNCVSGDYCDKPMVSCDCNSPCEPGAACKTVDDKPQCYCEDSCYFGDDCKKKRSTCKCSNPCNEGQICAEQSGQLLCGCTDPCKTGPNCNQTVQTCDCLKPCVGNEKCIEGQNGNAPTCICEDKCTYGEGCQNQYDTCECNNPCNPGQMCTNINGKAVCSCADECKTGPDCNEAINSCKCNSPCSGAQQCHKADNGELQCSCADKCYYGEKCDKKVNTCECSPCGSNEICLSDDGAKTGCGCESDCHYGPGCARVVDSCECNNPCSAGEICSTSANGQLTCGCEDSCRTGSGCKEYINTCRCNNPCQDGETCSKNDAGELYCYCEDSCKTGPGCTQTVNSCKCNNPCVGDEVCVDGVNGNAPTCICSDNCTYGEGCSSRYDNCKCNNPCTANQVCSMTESGDGKQTPACSCADPCRLGDTCTDVLQTCECSSCPDGESCKDTDAGPSCYCENNCRTGSGCTEVINTCECNNPCSEGQECYLDDFGKPACRCTDPCMTGENCETRIKSCQCQNPCEGYGECLDSVDGPSCNACFNPCHKGPLCRDLKNTCECNNTCTDYQKCTDDAQSGPQCSCPDCYEGDDCSKRINSCACNNPCSQNGRCHDSKDGPICKCNACWTGDSCDVAKNTCECVKPCEDYQECVNDGNNHKCQCPDCFTGVDCSKRIDSCKCNNPCEPADLCQDTNLGKPICKCDCIGNEVCFEDTITLRQECRCPPCYYNKEGERGCPSKITHTCECNTCTGEQEVCVNNDDPEGDVLCKIGNPSTGHSFTVVFEENHTEKSIRQIPLELYFSSAVWADGSRRVRVKTPGLHKNHYCYVNELVDVEENTVARFPLERCLMQNRTGLNHLAIRVTEVDNKTISVYGINKDRWTADGFLALPDEQAGYEFQTTSYSPAHIATQFAVVVLYDDTQVTMTMADDNNLEGEFGKKGAVFTTKLQAFDTYQVQARCPGKRPSLFTECKRDLTGTEIISDKPIHVFSGNIRAWVPGKSGKSRDHLIEQITPRDRWGTDFAIISIPNRVVGDIIQIMAINGQSTKCHLYSRHGLLNSAPEEPQEISLPFSERHHRNINIPSQGMYRLKCENPVFVTQFTKSQDQIYLYNNETFHDPVSITVPPISQFTNNYFLNTPQFTGGENYQPQSYNTTFAMMVARKGEETTITLNQQPIEKFEINWKPLPKSLDPSDKDLVGAVVRVPHGTNIIRNDARYNFQCLVYGYDDRESYGFAAGMALTRYRG